MAMIRKCECGNEYGLWRPRCPACGTTNERQRDATAPPEPTFVRAERTPKRPCIVCRNGGAKDRCPHCEELIHKNCKGMHVIACAEFQRLRAIEIAKLGKTVLDNPVEAKRLINDLVLRRER